MKRVETCLELYKFKKIGHQFCTVNSVSGIARALCAGKIQQFQVKSIVVQRKMSEKKKREKEGGLFRRVNGT
jgi:hypothetical protein